MINIKKAIAKKPRWLAVVPYLERYIPFPFFLLVHVTLGCKKKCEFCYQVRDPFFARHEGIISLVDFKRVLTQASNSIYKPHIHLIGGEPLNHPDFLHLLDLCRRHGFKPTFTTNGRELSKYKKILQSSNVTQINVSLSTDNVADPVPGHVLQAIKELSPQISFNLNCIVTEASVPKFYYTVKRCSDLFAAGEISLFVLQHWGFDRVDLEEALRIDVTTLKNQIEEIEKESLAFQFISLPDIKVEDIEGYYKNWGYPFKRKCYVPWLGLSIYPDLTVGPGGATFSCASPIGSLKDHSLGEIWHSPALRRFRQQIRKELPERCSRCCQNMYY